MILILSSDDDHDVEPVTQRLDALGLDYHRFDPARFPAEAQARVWYGASGMERVALVDRGANLDLCDVTAVWHRRPGRPGGSDGPHAEIVAAESGAVLAGIWASLECLWMPGRPGAIAAAQNKVRLLDLAAKLGFRVPRTLVTNEPKALLDFYEECGGRIVGKALWQGTSVRDGETHLTYTHPIRRRDLLGYQAIRNAPVMFQEYVSKQIELRITVVGSTALTAAIDSQASRRTRHDWRHYDNERARYTPYALPQGVENMCIRLLREVDLTFGAIDMVLTPAGEYVFLEINPSGQWSWIEALTGLPIADAIANLLAGTKVDAHDRAVR